MRSKQTLLKVENGMISPEYSISRIPVSTIFTFLMSY